MSRNDTGPVASAAAAMARDRDRLRGTIDPAKPATQQRQPTSALVAVYDGRQWIGHLLHRGRDGVEAYDIGIVSIGLYDTMDAAAAALWRLARNQVPQL
jgi:hypothetical protein